MLVAGVDTDRFTPKMVQVAVQSALANADPPALCPLEDGIRKYDPRHPARWSRRCAPRSPVSRKPPRRMIDQARRYGRIGGVDLALAEKVVGAGAQWPGGDHRMGSGRSLTAWRFGLATGTGVTPPDRLLDGSARRSSAHSRPAHRC